MVVMKKRRDIPRRFFSTTEADQVTAAIAQAESGTSGEIRVFIERDFENENGDPYERAREVFAELGMHHTAERNGVLVYLALRSQGFAVVGDEELHRRVGDDYWSAVRDGLAAEFAATHFVAGLIAAIEAIGKGLARHFPPRADDVNELPDDIAY
jgi:uncharacterized membrane protein